MSILLAIHILSGSLALVAAAVAIGSAKGKKHHILAGKTYVLAMLGIFLSAIPMAIITSNLFLFLVAIFSFYMAFAGMRFARNRKGIATNIDWVAIGLMLLSGAGMLALSTAYFLTDNPLAIVLLVFGLLSISLGYQNLRAYRDQTLKGPQRIARHLSNMMGGTIAVTTAVLVVNVNIEPSWVTWVLPSALITPVIIWWNRKVLSS